ncbi:hypothetical protein GCM10027168_08850 [Streptomyces capparidis]
MTEPTAEHFWETRYTGTLGRIWSGAPNRILADTARPLPPGTALDLGCGEGGDAVWLATQGWRVTAVDVSPTALKRTTDLAAEHGVTDRVTTEQHDLAATFPTGTYDLITAQYLQTPLTFPRPRVLREAAHHLTPGGLLLVVDHGSLHPWSTNTNPHFPTPDDVYAELALPSPSWEPLRLATPEREATGPNGEKATVTDIVVAIRRREG